MSGGIDPNKFSQLSQMAAGSPDESILAEQHAVLSARRDALQQTQDAIRQAQAAQFAHPNEDADDMPKVGPLPKETATTQGKTVQLKKPKKAKDEEPEYSQVAQKSRTVRHEAAANAKTAQGTFTGEEEEVGEAPSGMLGVTDEEAPSPVPPVQPLPRPLNSKAVDVHAKALRDALQYLLRNAPAAWNPLLRSLLKQLEKLKSSSPYPKDADARLSRIGKQLNLIASKLPAKQKKQYIELEEKDFEPGEEAIQEQISMLEEVLNTNKAAAQQYQKAQALMSPFAEIGSKIGTKDFSGNAIGMWNLMTKLMNLANEPGCPPQLQNLIIQQVDSVAGLLNSSAHETGAEMLAMLSISAFAQQYEGRSLNDFTNIVMGYCQKLDPSGKSALMKQVVANINNILQKPETAKKLGILNIDKHGCIQPLGFLNDQISNWFQSPNLQGLTDAKNTISSTSSQANSAINGFNTANAEIANQIEELHTYLSEYQDAADGGLIQNFSGGDDTQFPPNLQPDLARMLSDLSSFLQTLKKSGKKEWAPLIADYETELKSIKKPVTVGGFGQLSDLMESINGLASELPRTAKDQIFVKAKQLFADIEVSASACSNQLANELQSLMGQNAPEYAFAILLQQAVDGAQAWQRKPLPLSAIMGAGNSILNLMQLEGQLPSNSPLVPQIQSAIKVWEAAFPSPEMLGHALWAALVHGYANQGTDGTVKGFSRVEQEVESLNGGSDQTLNAAVSWIKKTYPPTWPGYHEKQPKPPSDIEFSNGMIVTTCNQLEQEMGNASFHLPNVLALQNVLNDLSAKIGENNLQKAQGLEDGIQNSNGVSNYSARQQNNAANSLGKNPPQKGSYLQKALTPMVQAEIQTLESLINFLKKWGPAKDRGKLKQLQHELDEIKRNFPAMGQKAMQQLSDMLGQLNTLSGDLPAQSYRSTYWRTVSNMFDQLSQIAQATTDNNSNVYKSLGTLYNVLALWESGKASPSDLALISSSIETLMENGTVFSYGDSSQVESFLKALQQIKGGSLSPGSPSSTLGEEITLEIQHDLLQQYLNDPSSSSKTPDGFRDFIQNYISQNFPHTDSAALRQMEQNLLNVNDCIASPTNPNPLFALGTYDPSTGMITMSSTNTIDQLEQNFFQGGIQPPPGGWAALISDLQSSENQYDPSKNGIKQISQMIQSLKQMAEVTSKKRDSNESLADLFREAILDHYMPAQEAELAEIALELDFNNLGAKDTNDLLNDLSDFAQADNNYDFSSLLHGGTKGQYPGTADNANAVLQNEKNACANDINAIKKAVGDIDQQIKDLENNHKYDDNPKLAAAKQKLIGQLQGYKDQLVGPDGKSGALLQVTHLQDVLSHVTITSGGSGDTFTVTVSSPYSVKDIQTAEDLVINGDGNAKPPAVKGGLSAINSLIKGDQQDYSNQSQTQQMTLQLNMTEIQQEWTIVATVMTSLNQSYMTIAQGIYK